MGSKGFPSKYRPWGAAVTQHVRYRRIHKMVNSRMFETSPVRRKELEFKNPVPKRRPALHDMIGRKLRHHYEESQQHPLPARLAVLLDLLDQPAEDAAAYRRN